MYMRRNIRAICDMEARAQHNMGFKPKRFGASLGGIDDDDDEGRTPKEEET